MLLYRRIIFFSILWSICWCAKAQLLSVSSFKCNPTDLDARVDFPVRDHNGKTCALIKVENTNTGYHFETGILSIPKVEQKVGEIWVYVQPGVLKMTIKHQNLGILRDYFFPEPLKEATVYVMKLETRQINTTPNKAAERMNFLSQYEKLDAKTLYETGDKYYEEKNYTKAVEYLQKAAEKNYGPAQDLLGYMYYHGYGIEKNYNKAIELFRIIEDPFLQTSHIGWLLNGFIEKKIDTKAIECIQKAAEQGDATAQNNLGFMYEWGYGVEKIYTKAVEWYRKAAEQNDAAGQCYLGDMYQKGCGVEKNYNKAVDLYRKAIAQNYARAQYKLGYMYEYGYGVEKNYNKAIEWYRKAAAQNYASAQYKLGYMYEYGRGCEVNYGKAAQWYRMAAEQGYTIAEKALETIGAWEGRTLQTTRFIANNPTTTKPISTPPTTTTTAPSSNNKQKINTVAEKRIALIIGNGDYANGRLSNPTNDAQDITKKLKSLGFETMGRTNLGFRKMKDGITEFCEKAKGYDAAIFYYAGHAMQDKGINYLVPIGAQIKSNTDIEYECIDMNWVLSIMEEAGIKTKIIILDACRNNPVAQSWERSFSSSGLTAITSVPEGTFLVFATQAGKVAKDGVGQRNSPYTKALLEMLDVPGLPVHVLFHEVKKLVAKQTNQEQKPSDTNNLPGDFIINAQ